MKRLRTFVRQRPWLTVGATTLAVAASGAILAHTTGLTGRAWAEVMTWRAEQFTRRGYEAWQAGMIREAELALVSAIEMTPHALRPRLLHGRMLLQQKRREEGRRIFLGLLEQSTSADRAAVANVYLDALLATGWYEELARFARAEWENVSISQRPHWAAAALHGVRLGRLSPGPEVALAPPATVGYLDALLIAQLQLNAGRSDAALQWLGAVKGRDLAGPVRYAAMRLALDLGRPGSARSFFLGAALPLSRVELALGEIWLGTQQGELSSRQIERLLPQAFPAGQGQIELLASLACVLELDLPVLPRFLAERFRAEEPQLADATVAALWLVSDLNQRRGAANPWSPALQRRLGLQLISLEPGTLTSGRYTSLINSLPLARDTVIALLSRVDEPIE